MQRRIQRALFDLQDVLRAAFDRLGDGVAVGGSEPESAKDQQVQRALHELDALASSSGSHSRRDDIGPDLECQGEQKIATWYLLSRVHGNCRAATNRVPPCLQSRRAADPAAGRTARASPDRGHDHDVAPRSVQRRYVDWRERSRSGHGRSQSARSREEAASRGAYAKPRHDHSVIAQPRESGIGSGPGSASARRRLRALDPAHRRSIAGRGTQKLTVAIHRQNPPAQPAAGLHLVLVGRSRRAPAETRAICQARRARSVAVARAGRVPSTPLARSAGAQRLHVASRRAHRQQNAD